ncbi:MAG: carbohydrate-binding domain-containing protein [Clostridia bacterium]|nr:carbohydrate-binding domain-containing protein [Clostridia bacterium]
MKRFFSLLLALLTVSAVLLTSCGGGNTPYVPEEATTADTSGMDMSFTERDASASYGQNVKAITFSGNTVSGAELENKELIIKDEGTYILSGEATDISIKVDAPEKKVQLVLNGLTLNNSQGYAIYLREAKKVFLTLADGTENYISDAESYEITDGDTTVDGAIFSKADLTVNGKGSLTVNGNYKHGIDSKDDFICVNAKITITSKGMGIGGKDCVKLKDASLTINAGSDAIRSYNDTDSAKGFVYIESGSYTLTALSDGIQAASVIKIADGTFDITSGESLYSQSSGKGIKAVSDLNILGGVFKISSYDDALHSNRSVFISDGALTLSSGDDGIHADADLSISGGNILVFKSYEGLEGERILISGGEIDVTASDDGLNAAGGNDGSGMGGPFGGGDMFGSSDAEIVISGGYLLIDASGDGIDSNGALTVTGGVTLVSGPTNSGNGSLDYGSKATVSGGVFIATGSYGMAQGFSNAENQGAIITPTGTQTSGTSIALCDEDGKVIASFTPSKAYQSLVISAPEIKKGDAYSVICGGTAAEADKNGYASGTEISGGRTVVNIEMSSLLYGSSQGMGGGGMGGGMGPGGHGNRPGGGMMPPR